jgi:hypothetical protein
MIKNKRPTSVTTIAIVTLVSDIIVLSLFGPAEFIFLLLGAVLFALMPVLLEMYALVISVLMLRSDSKNVWYASITFWILVIATDLAYSLLFVYGSMVPWFVLTWALPPMICSNVCLVLFSSKKVRSYFSG